MKATVEVLLYVHRNRRFIRDGSPGRLELGLAARRASFSHRDAGGMQRSPHTRFPVRIWHGLVREHLHQTRVPRMLKNKYVIHIIKRNIAQKKTSQPVTTPTTCMHTIIEI